MILFVFYLGDFLLVFVGFCWFLLDFVVGFCCWILLLDFVGIFFVCAGSVFDGFCLFLVPSSPNIGANKKIQIHTYKLVLP